MKVWLPGEGWVGISTGGALTLLRKSCPLALDADLLLEEWYRWWVRAVHTVVRCGCTNEWNEPILSPC